MTYGKLPISLINKYIWDLAKAETQNVKDAHPQNMGESNEAYATRIAPYLAALPFNTDAYNGIQPIFPVSENLALDTQTTPFIIYDFLFSPPNGTMWFLEKEQATYTIVGDMPNLFYAKQFIYEALKKFDTSAQEMNNYLNDSDIKFKYIKCDQSSFMIDEKRIDSFKPKYVTSLTLTYEYTK